MDKQQAAENWCIANNDSENSYFKILPAFQAGWEACLATLSPTDAVNFVHWILKNGWRVLEDYTFYKEIKAGGRIIKGARDLYTEFSPSGAAPQYGDKNCEHCDGDGYISVKEAGGDTVTQMYCPHCEARNEAMLETLETSTAPPAAGPVWVRHSKKFPEDWISVINRNRHTKQVITEFDVEKAEGEYFLLEGGRTVYYYDCEWLDESSTQQVFTREQKEELVENLFTFLKDKWLLTKISLSEWFDINYPEVKG